MSVHCGMNTGDCFPSVTEPGPVNELLTSVSHQKEQAIKWFVLGSALELGEPLRYS